MMLWGGVVRGEHVGDEKTEGGRGRWGGGTHGHRPKKKKTGVCAWNGVISQSQVCTACCMLD